MREVLVAQPSFCGGAALPKLYRVTDVMEILSVSRSTVYRLVESGRLELVQAGPKCARVTAESVDTFRGAQGSPAPRLYRVPTAAKMLGVSRATIYRMVADGTLQRVKIGPGGSRITSESIGALQGDAQTAFSRLYTVKEVAAILNVGSATVYRLVKAGRLQLVKVGQCSSRVTEEGIRIVAGAGESGISKLHSIKETAAMLNASPATVYRMVKGGELRLVKIGPAGSRISADSIEAALARRAPPDSPQVPLGPTDDDDVQPVTNKQPIMSAAQPRGAAQRAENVDARPVRRPKLIHVLDDLQLRRWIAKGEAVAKSDGDGLTFTLSAAGTASWILRYRFGGRRPELTLGNYPDISLAAARKLARAHRAAIDGGADPATEKRTAKARSVAAWSVKALVADFEEKVLQPPLADGTIYYRKCDLKNVIVPKLGPLAVRDVTPADVVDMIESCRRPWTVSKRILTTATQLFDHAAGRRMIDANPCAGIKLAAIKGPKPPVKKRVMLSEEELRTLLSDVDSTIGPENGLVLRILLATCVRSVELAKARWEDVDFQRNTWFVPDRNVKTRTGFLVPITPTVREWFLELRALAGDSAWVLPARARGRRRRIGDTHVGTTTLWAAIDRAFKRRDLDVRRFTPHDTRSTAKGHMMNMKIPKPVTELALNHKLIGMEAIYDVREDIPERREALERWAAFIVACVEGRTWNTATCADARRLVTFSR